MTLPPDSPPPPVAVITDPGPPPVSDEQRAADFHRVFTWRGKEIAFTIASELYYRELRVHTNAPPLSSYQTMGDFAAEATRVLYCAHQSAKQIRALRSLPVPVQVELFENWVEANIALHELDAAAELAQQINDTIARARTQPVETGDSIDGAGN